MQFKIKNKQDFWSGLLFIGIGLIVLVISHDYFMGSVFQMGPGYFPACVGIILLILGVITALTSFRVEGEEIRPFAWRGIVLLTLSFVIFGWAVDRIGFVLTMFAMIVCSMSAGKKVKLLELLIMCVVLIASSIALFIYGLKLPFRLFWW